MRFSFTAWVYIEKIQANKNCLAWITNNKDNDLDKLSKHFIFGESRIEERACLRPGCKSIFKTVSKYRKYCSPWCKTTVKERK